MRQSHVVAVLWLVLMKLVYRRISDKNLSTPSLKITSNSMGTNMAPSAIAQRRTHNLLLFQKLLNLRDGASPFTLLLDTLEQSAQSVVQEFMMRAKVSKAMHFVLLLSCFKHILSLLSQDFMKYSLLWDHLDSEELWMTSC